MPTMTIFNNAKQINFTKSISDTILFCICGLLTRVSLIRTWLFSIEHTRMNTNCLKQIQMMNLSNYKSNWEVA